MASACRVVKTKTSECHQPRKYCPNIEFFPVFGIRTEVYSVHIQSESGKIRTRKDFVFAQFLYSGYYKQKHSKTRNVAQLNNRNNIGVVAIHRFS